jgi:hypothetical protein
MQIGKRRKGRKRKEKKRVIEGLDLLNVVVGVGVDGPVKAVKLVIDETDVCNVKDPGGAHMEDLRELEGDGLLFNIVAHTCRGDTMRSTWKVHEKVQ